MTDEPMSERADSGPPPIINIVGEMVALGPLHRGLLPLFERWDNDFWTMDRGGNEVYPASRALVASQWQPLIRGERPDWLGFAIYALPELRPIGTTNIRDFTNTHGTAELGITIAEASYRGRGYGTEAVKLLLDYAFTVLGVHSVWLDTASYNLGAIRAYEKAGFREIGRRRGALTLAGQRYDVVLMDCIAEEFVPPTRRALTEPAR